MNLCEHDDGLRIGLSWMESVGDLDFVGVFEKTNLDFDEIAVES